MSKQEQLVEFSVQDIIDYIMQDNKIDIEEAMNRFYSSTTFDKLQDIETGLYLESAAYVYDIYKDEMEAGQIIQKEI